MNNATMRSAAHKYADAGIPVGPCNGKIPLTKRGFQDFTVDRDQIDAWWTEHPAANIGGCPPLVVDVDVRNNGHINLVAFKAEHSAVIPKTLTAETGGSIPGKPKCRGLHIYFTLPTMAARSRWKGQLCQGVDLKFGHKGYVIMPPSLHPSGNRYRWISDHPIATAPAWLVDHGTHHPIATMPRRTCAGSKSGLVRTVAEAVEGSRHGALVWAAATARDEGILTTELAEQLTDAARNVGLPDSEIAGVLRWTGVVA